MKAHRLNGGIVLIEDQLEAQLMELLGVTNGTRIRKVRTEDSDSHDVGAMGTVIGSIQFLPDSPICYFVEWDDSPRKAVAVIDNGRIEPWQ